MTVTHPVDLISDDLASKLKKKAELFTLYSLALDESNDIKKTAKSEWKKKSCVAQKKAGEGERG